MTTPPRTGPAGHGNGSIEARVHEYLKRANRLIPVTPEEVEAMERWISEQDIQVPEELLRREGCSLTPCQPKARVLKFPAPSDEVEQGLQGLARAAREGGKPISAEVESRMKRDREQQERESKGDK